MKPYDDFSDQKPIRREKQKPKNKREFLDDDDAIKRSHSRKEIKKIKESYQDEEWKDWDEYYNH